DVADAPVAPPPAAGQAPHGPAAQRQREARGRVQRRRRRPAGPQEMRSLAAAADRRPRGAAVRLVQLEESDVFVSQPVDGVIWQHSGPISRSATAQEECHSISAGCSHLTWRLSGPALERMRECTHLMKTEQPRDLGYMQLAVIKVTNC